MRRSVVIVAMAAVAGCGGGSSEDQEEVAQAAGDAMASLDEVSQGASFAVLTPGLRLRPGFRTPWQERVADWVLPRAHAAACTTLSFSSCLAGVKTLDLDACTLGGITLDGTVTLTFSNPIGCLFPGNGDTITRTADFTLTGRRGASIHVTSAGGGQRVTRTSGGFTYTVLGMRRVGTTAGNETLFDVSTHTSADITVTGTTRATRVMDGGTLIVEHDVRNYSVALTPDQVSWSATCNCPTSGTLTGEVTGTVTGTAVVTFTGCGTADLAWRGTTASVSLDRCAGS